MPVGIFYYARNVPRGKRAHQKMPVGIFYYARNVPRGKRATYFLVKQLLWRAIKGGFFGGPIRNIDETISRED